MNDPGIGVTRDAQLALDAGRVTAMHEPTEGGLATALWELAQASGRGVRFEPAAVPVTPLSAQVCAAFTIDPLTAIASGALLLTAPAPDAGRIRAALEQEGIPLHGDRRGYGGAPAGPATDPTRLGTVPAAGA